MDAWRSAGAWHSRKTGFLVVWRCLPIIVACAVQGCDVAGPSTFSKSYGGPLHDQAAVVLNTDDGGFMLFGTADGDELEFAPETFFERAETKPRRGDLWLQKLDANGNVEQSRTIGVRASAPPGTHWSFARSTSDGGLILTGWHDTTTPITRPGGHVDQLTIATDFAVAKLDAGGNTQWSVTYDSGAWPNYDFFSRGDGTLPESKDTGVDVWPMSDGGYLVAGYSLANLEDRSGIGFPHCDEELRDVADLDSCDEQPGRIGGQLAEALSMVVLRLNSDGSLRWQRRLMDNSFAQRGNDDVLTRLHTLIRATHDGGVVLARPVRGGTLVHRLGGDGSPRWRAVLDIEKPTALVQTDDPVDNGQLDGMADDGFAVAGSGRVIQLNADGTVKWDRNVAPLAKEVTINDLVQRCDYGDAPHCDIIAAVGSHGDARAFGFADFLTADGLSRRTYVGTIDAPIAAVTGVRVLAGNRCRLLGVDLSGHVMLIDFNLDDQFLTNFLITNVRGVETDDGSTRLPEFRMDGNVLLLGLDADHGVGEFSVMNGQGEIESTRSLMEGIKDNDVLRAAAQIGPNSFIIAGIRSGSPPDKPEREVSDIVVLRYDLSNASSGGVIWQKRLVSELGGDVLAAVPTHDGGVVLSLFLRSDVAETGRPSPFATVAFLLKLDSNGDARWRRTLPGLATQLQRMPDPDHGFAALMEGDGSSTWVARFSADGETLWQNSVFFPVPEHARSIRAEALATTAEGGLLLAGSDGRRLRLARLAPDGALLSASEVAPIVPPGSRDFDISAPLIRQAPDGGLVLAMTESGLINSVSDVGTALPFGQSNVLVLKLDAAFRFLWSRVYGAAFDEGVKDLALRTDGTIAIAGFSDSLGDRRQAWLLKLASDGLVSSDGCQALLREISAAGWNAGVSTAVVAASATNDGRRVLPPFEDTSVLTFTPEDFVTARQCTGSATRLPSDTWHLKVDKLGVMHGVVTSVPSGISCGTALDICEADFPRGSRVTLSAEGSGFVGWQDACDENSGGTQPECVVVLNGDRTIRANFHRIVTLSTLTFVVQGPGSVLADGNILCNEGGSAESCSHQFGEGALVNVTAHPLSDFGGTGHAATFVGWSGDPVCSSLGTERSGVITIGDHDMQCVARFAAPNLHLLTIAVAGQGIVTDDPPRNPSLLGIRCREGDSGGPCEVRFAETTDVPLVADPGFGWLLAGWSGDCESFGANERIVVHVTDNMTCSALFERNTTPQTLTVTFVNGSPDRGITSDPLGIACFDGPGRDCTQDYDPGTAVVLRPNVPGGIWDHCDSLFINPVTGVSECTILMDDRPRIALFNFPAR